MPIQVKAPDGSIAQFPDGMADADIEKVMAQHYPQPSFMDRVAAFPLVRGVHDVIGGMIGGALNGPMQAAAAVNNAIPNTTPMDVNNPTGLDASYNDALARNRNTPGYAAARVGADKAMAIRGGSGFTDQLLAPFLPATAGAAGLLGGLDSSNAMADAQAEGQSGYAARHPVLSAGANILGGFLTGAPEGIAKNLPVYAGDNPLVTRAINPDAMGPLPLDPRSTPVSPAVDYVRGLVAKSGKTPTDLATFGGRGKPFTAAEAIGKPGEYALGALARRDGETGGQLAAQLSDRAESAPDRILGDFSAATGIDPAAARGDIKGLVANGRAQAAPLYDEAYAQAPVITDRLSTFAADPLVQKGMREGIRTEQLKALAKGEQFDPNAYAITHFNEAGDPVIGPVPTWRSWDAAKVGIDDILEQYRDKTTGRLVLDKRGNAINDVRKAMLNELDAVNPAYKTARAAAGDYLSAQGAFDNGGKMLLNGNMPMADFSSHFAGLDPGDQQAFAGGAANNLFNLAQNGKLTPKVFNRRVVQQKLAVMMGPDKATQFITALEREAQMAAFNRVQAPGAGSGSAPWLEAMRQQDNNGSLLPEALGWAGQVVEKGPIKGSISYGVGRGKDALAAYATRGMPVGVRDEAGRMLRLPPQQLGSDLARLPTLPVKGPARLPPPLLGLLGSRVRSAP